MSNTEKEKVITYPKNLFKGNYKAYEGKKPKHETVKRGKDTINWRDYIRANNVDVELYATLKKYGCIKEQQLNAKALYGEFEEFADMTGAHNKRVELDRMFKSLPLETRAMFNNDIDEFADHGHEYVEKIVKDEQEKQAQALAKQKEEDAKAKAEAKVNEEKYINELKKKLGLQ